LALREIMSGRGSTSWGGPGGQAMNWKGGVAITLIGAYAGAHAAHVKQQLHTTGRPARA